MHRYLKKLISYDFEQHYFIEHNCVCLVECNLARDCVGNELCIGGICQPTCHGNVTCPEYQYCLNNICVQELRCFTNNDCEDTHVCKTNTIGQVIKNINNYIFISNSCD